MPIALTLLLLAGWMFLPSPLFWTVTVSAIIIFPIFITSFWNTLSKPENVGLQYHIRNSLHDLGDVTTKTLFTLICLPFEAFLNGKALLLTLWRMAITRKRMLEWNPSSHHSNLNPATLLSSYAAMWIEPVLSMRTFCFFGNLLCPRVVDRRSGSPVVARCTFLLPGLQANL